MTGPVVGQVGVGILGRPIAEELLAAGVALVVHDVAPAAVEGLGAMGATVVASAGEVAARSSVVLVLVQTAEQCLTVVDELLATAAPGTLVAVMATVAPDTVRALAARAAARGVDLVDAPVAGQGEASVRAHTMWVLAGGDAATVERLRPAVAPWAERVVAAGPVGAGAALKLAHNVMVYLGYVSVVEALALARAAGVDDGLVAEVTAATGTLSGQSRVFLDIHERRRLDPGDAAEQAAFATYAALSDKDLGHAVELAAAAGLDLPGARLVSTMGADLYRVAAPEPEPVPVEPVPVELPEEVRSVFAGRPIAFVTSLRPDGRLSTVPMAVVLGDDGRIRLSTVSSRRKVRNLLADDRITLCVVQPDDLNRYVEVRGRATLEPDPERTFIDEVARRYMDVERYPFDRPDDARTTITVVPEHVSAPAVPRPDDGHGHA